MNLYLPNLSLHHLQTRIVAGFVVVVVAIGVVSVLLMHVDGTLAARKAVTDQVVVGAKAFERLLELDSQRLVEGARLLAADPAFRETATGVDRGTLGPELAKHGKRIGSAVTLLIDGDRRIAAGTLAAEIGKRFGQSKLLDRASAAEQSSALVLFGGQLYQMVVVPLRAPQPVAWLAAGIKIDDSMAQEMRALTGLDVTFLSRPEDGQWQARASTLVEPQKSELVRDVIANRYATIGSDGNAEYGEDAITRVINLAPRSDDGALAVLQSQLPAALEPLRAMKFRHGLVMLAGIVAAGLVALMLARGIAGPVRAITAAARRVGAGDYSPIELGSRRDEVGELATSFRAMQEGVAANVSRMTELAHRDPLTGLPTRVLFADRLEQAIAGGSRAGAPVAVMILNLDHFASRQRNARPSDRRHDAPRSRGEAPLGGAPRERQRRADWRRRVRHPDGGQPLERCAAGRRSRGARAGGEDDARRACRRLPGEHRHRRLSGSWLRHAEADAARGCRDASGQARPAQDRNVGRPVRRERREAPVADERPQEGGRQRRAHAHVSAEGGARRQRRALRRSARPLAAPGARARAAVRVRATRRADRLHPHDHAMGAASTPSHSAPSGAITGYRSTSR